MPHIDFNRCATTLIHVIKLYYSIMSADQVLISYRWIPTHPIHLRSDLIIRAYSKVFGVEQIHHKDFPGLRPHQDKVRVQLIPVDFVRCGVARGLVRG
jgi:hypothetical protein